MLSDDIGDDRDDPRWEDLTRHPGVMSIIEQMQCCAVGIQKAAWEVWEQQVRSEVMENCQPSTSDHTPIDLSFFADITLSFIRPALNLCWIPCLWPEISQEELAHRSREPRMRLPTHITQAYVERQSTVQQSSPTGSRFGGSPFLRSGESQPACGACGTLMELSFQIRLSDMPEEMAQPYAPACILRRADEGGDSLMQLLFCARCRARLNVSETGSSVERSAVCLGSDSDGYGQSSRPVTRCFRWIDIPDAFSSFAPALDDIAQTSYWAAFADGQNREMEHGEADNDNVQKLIGWAQHSDFPGVREAISGYNVDIGQRDSELIDRFLDDQVGCELQPIDKFGGFGVFWHQHDYPSCNLCGLQMTILVCVEDLCWPLDTGDGLFHVAICPVHKERFKCYM